MYDMYDMYDPPLIGKFKKKNKKKKKKKNSTNLQPSRGVGWTFIRKTDMSYEKLREKRNEIPPCYNSATKMFMKNCVKNAMKFLRVTTVPPKCS
jgi:hypothetical protein